MYSKQENKYVSKITKIKNTKSKSMIILNESIETNLKKSILKDRNSYSKMIMMRHLLNERRSH